MRNVYLLFVTLVFIQCNALPMNTLNIHNPSISSVRPLPDIPNKLSIAKTTIEQEKKSAQEISSSDSDLDDKINRSHDEDSDHEYSNYEDSDDDDSDSSGFTFYNPSDFWKSSFEKSLSIPKQTYPKILDETLLKPFDKVNEKAVHEYFSSNDKIAIKFKDQYLKKFNDAKIKWISENSENDFSGKTVLINDENVTLESKLGEGSFGVAYRAHLSPMEKFAVVKFPKTTGGIDIDFLRRCTDQEAFALRETDSLITYDKKNMVTIQKEIIGKSLYIHLKTLPESDPSFKELKSKYDKLAGEFIRKYDIVHGDVAPRNVILDPQGELHLIDFGSSIFVRPGHEEELITLASANADAEWQRAVLYNKIPAALASPYTTHSKQVIRGYQKVLKDLEFSEELEIFDKILRKKMHEYELKKKAL